MGIKYSSSESSSLIEAMNSNIEIANEITDRLSSGSDHLISVLESGKLQGAAYTAGKNLFSEIIIPSIKKLQSAIDDIQTELTSYKNADAVISGFGELDLDDLKTQKETREKQLAEVKSQIRENEKFMSLTGALITGKLGDHISKNNALHELEYHLQMGIDELKDKIEKLEWFVLQVSQYFSDSLQVLSLAIQGATQLSKIIVDNNGNYYVDGVDMTWFDKMKEQKIETLKYDSSKEIQKILVKLESGKELSEKEFQIFESFIQLHPQVQLPKEVLNQMQREISNRANMKKLEEKVEEIKKSDKTSSDKTNLIVTAYEDYLFYNNRAAFEEYRDNRKQLGDDWGKASPEIREKKKTIEKKLNNSLSKSQIDIKKLIQKMGDDILDVKEFEDKKRAELIQKGRSAWKSPGDNGTVDNSISVGVEIGDTSTFIELVNTKKPLDLKNRVYREDYPFSIWGRQWEKGMESDYLGNYLFGYVGKGYLGWGDDLIKLGAGKAQHISDLFKVDKYYIVGADIKYDISLLMGQYGDNEGDAAAIQDGIDDYKKGKN
ncbi:polymorphic toxin type 44 domain-containing protein [uncultured Streptococcus sp.]|uniref:polymorphic toxin type 44 domain-containing protein n=1 Tax=uncultured Streptococcus sp. TaxID=83427 RepID=UPI002612ACAD|nr:polymorphic toxin type 44 domain-containing protein [uncultured Streptococcus sp.]